MDTMTPETIKKFCETFFSAHPQRTFEAGEVIVQAGIDPPGVMYIAEGGVRQYLISDSGNKVVINSYKQSAFLHMSWAINSTPNDYFFEATTKTTLHIAPKEETVLFMKNNPPVMFDLLSRVFSGVDGVLMRSALLMSSSAYVRVLHELIIQIRRSKSARNTFTLDIKEHELAELTGLSRETVNREIKKLKAKKLVSAARTGVTILDRKQLEAELEGRL